VTRFGDGDHGLWRSLDARIAEVIEQQLGGAEQVETGELEVVLPLPWRFLPFCFFWARAPLRPGGTPERPPTGGGFGPAGQVGEGGTLPLGA